MSVLRRKHFLFLCGLCVLLALFTGLSIAETPPTAQGGVAGAGGDASPPILPPRDPPVRLRKSSTSVSSPNRFLRTSGFTQAFLASCSMILVSELGDKTFFIAAIMAMRHSKRTVFLSATAALALMTALSAAMGFTLPNLLPRHYTHTASIILFFVFGIRLLVEAHGMKGGEHNASELKEVEEELDEKTASLNAEKLEAGGAPAPPSVFHELLFRVVSPVWFQCFTLTLLAEWGDRSQIATIALAAAKDPIGVTLGGIVGHALCTMLAVLGGRLMATKISEKGVTMVGGVLFLLFAFHGLVVGAEEE